jgi:arginase
MNASLKPEAVTPLALTLFAGRVGDRNPRGMEGAQLLGDAIARQLRIQPTRIGMPRPPLSAGWQAELDAARAELSALSQTYDALLKAGSRALTVMGRCATGLATLPQVAKHRPDACVVWFDAHGDSNTPATSASGYLGGLVIAAAAGLWDSGLGAGLPLANVVLVGARDLDPPERKMIDAGSLRLVAPGPDLARRLKEAIGERPVYVHIDCDVLNPGLVPTEYSVEDGLSFADLRAASEILAMNEVIGLEIAEFEGRWSDTGKAASPTALIDALYPLIDAIR